MTDSVSQAFDKDGNVVTASAAVIADGIESGDLFREDADEEREIAFQEGEAYIDETGEIDDD